MELSDRNIKEVFQLLESTNIQEVEKATSLITEHLGTPGGGDAPLVALIDYYVTSGNVSALDLLCMVRQHQHKTLLNRLDDHLQKPVSRLKALCLLGQIVRSEPAWIFGIVPSKLFTTILKCLQMDTDLPTITSALYLIVTLMPKVASQLGNYITPLASVYVRLVSWHTIKPTGADEINLMHLHSAVYALFLCLYGMFPCNFLKFLRQKFTFPPATEKLSNTTKEKMRVYENSIQPMLDQVRFHSSLITESQEQELSSEKWRPLETHDILANICQLSLDPTENQASTISSNCYPPASSSRMAASYLQQQNQSYCDLNASNTSYANDMEWSLQMKQLMSPTAGGRPASPISPSKISNAKSPRPANLVISQESFIPHRPLQTASNASTPLRNFPSSPCIASPTLASIPSHIGGEGKKRHFSGEKGQISKENCQTLTFADDASKTDAEIKGEVVEQKDIFNYSGQDETGPKQPPETGAGATTYDSAHQLLQLDLMSKYVEKSPNQILDLHLQLVADSHAKFYKKFSSSAYKSEQWEYAHQHNNPTSNHNQEVGYLRSQVLQMHCAMLYERHKRELHSVRARKLMRKLYNAEVEEERNAALTFEVAELRKEIESLKQTQAALNQKSLERQAFHDKSIQTMEERWEQLSDENTQLKLKCQLLQTENTELTTECENIKNKMGEVSSKLFTAELEMDKAKKEESYVQTLEDKVQEQQIEMMKLSDSNFFLQRQIKLEGNDCSAKLHQSEMLMNSYQRELEYLKCEHRESLKNLELYMQRSERLDKESQEKDDMIEEHKTRLENTEAMLRSQLEAVESKYTTQKNITQRLEIQVMDLFSRLTAYEGEMTVVQLGQQQKARVPPSPEKGDW